MAQSRQKGWLRELATEVFPLVASSAPDARFKRYGIGHNENEHQSFHVILELIDRTLQDRRDHTSVATCLHCWIQGLQFDAGMIGIEAPIHRCAQFAAP